MPKPRRRRRFFALEGRFEVDDTGELQGIAQSEPPEAASAVTAENEVPAGTEPALPGSLEKSDAPDPSPEDELPPAFRLQRTPRPHTETKGRSLFNGAWYLVAGLAAGAIAGYYLRRPAPVTPAVETHAAAPNDAFALTPADQADLDAAYTARHARKYTEAEQLFTALERRHPGWGPMEVELGRTQYYDNKAYDASFTLKAAADKGNSPAEANFLLGMLNKARRSYPEAEVSFAKAVAIDPTQPEYYFFWGECLREEGKLLEATGKFHSALLRNQYETATGLYRAKLWLCAIEADQAAKTGVDAEIDAALAERYPPMEAFIAAAARDLKANDLRAAVAHLASANQRADPVVVRYILGDPFFAETLSKPEVAAIFRSGPPDVSPGPVNAAGPPAPAPGR